MLRSVPSFVIEECSYALQVRSAYAVQLVGPLPSFFSCTTFCPQRVVWISVCKRQRAGIAMMFRPTLDNSQ